MTIELVKVARVEARPNYILHVLFTNGEEGEADFSWILQSDWPVVEPLKQPEFFQQAFVSFGVPAWPNGFDVDAIKLHSDMREQGRLRKPAA